MADEPAPEPEAENAPTIAQSASASAEYMAATTKEGYRDASAGVDNLMNTLIDKAALITKHWKLPATTGAFYLTVRHYAMTKMYILSISGLLVLVNSKVVYRHTDLIEDKLEVPFTLSGQTGKLVIEATAETRDKKSKQYTYTLSYGGDEQRSDFLEDVTDPANADLGESTEVTTAPEIEIDGSKVQLYTIEATIDGRRVSVNKRFKEFDTLQRLLRSAYAESAELQRQIPALPRKTFGRNRGPEFIETRRAGLEAFMQGVLAVDHMNSNPDLLHFMGILSDMPGAGDGGSGGQSMPPSQPEHEPSVVADLDGHHEEEDDVDEDEDEDAL